MGGCVVRAPLPPALSPDAAATGPSREPAVVELADALTALFADPSTGPIVWGVHVRALDRGETLYSLNADTLLIPASTQKLVTLAVAAEQLGWGYQFETRLVANRPVVDGVLTGDLVVVGSGDPTIGRWQEDVGYRDADRVFVNWAAQLRAGGIREIRGRIVGDDRALANGTAGPGSGLGDGWSWNDLGFGFAAPVGALQFRENMAEITIEPGAVAGAPPAVVLDPPASGLDVVNRLVTVAADGDLRLRLLRLPGQPMVELRGSIPLGTQPVRRTVSVDNPTSYFVRALRQTLIGEGIAVRGASIDIDDLPPNDSPDGDDDRRVLVRHTSQPLSEVAVDMMHRSQSLFAETLFRTLGQTRGEGSLADSQTAVAERLATWGVGPEQFIVADGSGLSRYNYLTAHALVEILGRVHADPEFAVPFEAALPRAGRDGTLESRMDGTLAAGSARAKTGSMSNVSALSGYVNTQRGETLAFAILANNYRPGLAEINAIIDAAVVRLASLAR